MSVYGFVAVVILLIELAVFIIYGVDKLKAKKGSFRIPEATLIIAALFGPVGAFLGMHIWHHKTRKPKFFITVPVFLVIRVILVILVCRRVLITTKILS